MATAIGVGRPMGMSCIGETCTKIQNERDLGRMEQAWPAIRGLKTAHGFPEGELGS